MAKGPEAGLAETWRPWAELSLSQRRLRSERAAWATLELLPVSLAADRLVAAVLAGAVIPAKQEKLQTPLRPSSLLGLKDATGALLGDVLQAAANGWAVKRSARKEAFTGFRIGRTAWGDVTVPLVAHGLLDYAAGKGKAPETFGTARAPLWCATPKLVALAREHGIEIATIGRHFQKPKA